MNRLSPSRLGSSCRLFPAALLLASLGPALPGAAADSTWNPTSGASYWDGPTSWSAGQPGAGDLATFTNGGTSDAWWGAGTGDTTTEDLTVDATDVTFLSLFSEQAISVGNGQPAIKTYTVTDDVRIENGGVLTLGRANEALNLTVGDDLQVRGGGTFNARFGSTVTTTDFYVARFGSGDAFATIDGAGATLDVASSTILGTNGSTGTLSFINNSDGNFLRNNLSLVNSFVANSSGVLNITGGSTVTHTAGQLTAATNGVAGQSATILVDGSGSEFISQSSEQMLLGAAANSTATLTVSNGGSFTSTSGETRVFATGTIDLQGGTYTSAGDLSLVGGTFNQSGGFFNLAAGRTLSASSDAQISLTGSYNIDDGTTFDLSGGADLTTANYLDIGNVSDGTLLVDGAGTTVTTNTTITGLAWFIGQGGGHGTVTLSNGASFTANDQMQVAWGFQAGTAGTLDILSGATMATDGAQVGSSGGPGTAVITVDGAGSALTITDNNTLTIGNTSNGSATINLTNGGTLNTGTGLTTLRATAVINATGGTLNVNGDLLVNGASLTIDGFFSLADGATAFTATNDAQVTFDYGWSIDGGSTYRVASGADLVMGDLVIIGAAANPGFSDFGDGTLIIDGDGSSLDYGNQLSADPLFIADAPGVSGTLTVQNGAAATIGADILFLSLNGDAASSGTINLLSGGTMTTNEIQVAAGGAGDGTINIDGVGSRLILNGTSELTIGGGTGTATVNVGNNAGLFLGVSGFPSGVTLGTNGTLNIQPGANVTVNGELTLQGGTINFTGGQLSTVLVDGDLVNAGGQLSRFGTSSLINELTITGDYTQEQDGEVVIDITRVADLAYDRLAVEGHAHLDGTLLIAYSNPFEFSEFAAGDRLDILDWGTLSGTFSQVDSFISISGLGLNLQDLYLTGEISFELLGDANTDGFVGVEDLDILLANWGDSVNPYDYAAGDLTGDGLVGSADLAVVQANWGSGTPGGGDVPEPGTLAMLGLGGLAMLRRPRR